MTTDFDPVEQALAALIQGAASPAVQEAQVLLLRRLALEGSVLPSRIPAPANITEFGGYLNLLAGADMATMRTSALASALGLASPAAVIWDDTPPPLGLSSVGNDRRAIAQGAGLALAVPMRTDIAAAWRNAVVPRLSELGATLPLWAPPVRLPASDPSGTSVDPLLVLGRVVWIAPEAALGDPDTDRILLGRKDTEPADALTPMLRVGAGSGVAPEAFNALAWDDTANTAVQRAIGLVATVSVASVVALAGFETQAQPAPPLTRNDLSWARLTNRAGLLSGVSTLGDELLLVWSPREIARSAFSARVREVWNGSAFVPQ